MHVSRILISGASGLIGSALAPSLKTQGHEVLRLVRRRPHGSNELQWNPTAQLDPVLVSGFDVVIHLSGENIAGRWTAQKKRRIRDSRIFSTDFLSQALARAEKKPHTFICASAIGYYGNRGDEVLAEESRSGDGFLPEVCREWEHATQTASDAGIRVVNLRTGIVLSRNGGALKPMLLPFKLGLGGRIGDGSQYWSWIHIADFVSAIHYMMSLPAPAQIRGPVNMVAPKPVTNAEFTRVLADALKRPARLPMPAFVLRLLFGELADESLLASARVLPNKLVETGFEFRHATIKQALNNLL